MKTFYPVTTLLIGLLLTAGNTNAQNDVNEYLKGKETENSVFVITKDSVKHEGTAFKWNYSFATFKIDGVKYKRRKLPDIIAYQSETSYNVYIPDIKDDAARLRKGKINLYTYYVTSWATSSRTGAGEASLSRFYLVEKERNNFIGASFYTLEQFFSDKPAVLQKYHELFPNRPEGGKPYSTKSSVKEEALLFKQMILLVDMYNQN